VSRKNLASVEGVEHTPQSVRFAGEYEHAARSGMSKVTDDVWEGVTIRSIPSGEEQLILS